MMKLFPAKCVLPSLWLFVVICSLFAAPFIAPASAAAATEKPSTEQAAETPTVVGKIGTYEITRKELESRLMTEIHPYDQDYYDPNTRPATAMDVLNKMLAEKAMIMEARKQTYLQDETISSSIKRYRDRRLVNLLVQKHVEKNRDKINATEDEIKQAMQADPKLDKERAKANVERTKASKLLDEYYKQIYARARTKKLDQNFARAIEVYQRLMTRPKTPRKVPWMQTSQVREDLVPAEKNMVLALYSGGKVTLKDWLTAYCDVVPPRRPKINTPADVDALLERALGMPLLVWEAESLGLDKDPELLKQVRDYEDNRLLGEVQRAKYKEVAEPTPEQIVACFNEHKAIFGTSDTLQIDVIWSDDLPAAKKVKAELESGKDFEAVKEQYSLQKKSKPFHTQASSEGLFWKALWAAAEPGRVLGPLKGFYGQGVKWRIVKILEKKPGQPKEYDSKMDSQIKGMMMSEQRKELITQYGRELLKKYPHEIVADRVSEIDLLDIP